MDGVITNTAPENPPAPPPATSTTIIDASAPLKDYQKTREDRRAGKIADDTPVEVEKPAEKPVETKPEAKVEKDDDGPVVSKRQQYINELIREKTRAEMRAEQAEARLKEREGAKETKPEAPKVDGFDTWETWIAKNAGQSYEDYIDARTDFRYAQRQQAQERETARKRTSEQWQEHTTEYTKRADTARTRYQDFDEVMARPLATPLRQEMADFFLTSPAGPDLAYFLSAHPDDYARISAMPVARMWAELGKLETAVDPEKKTPVATAPSITKAPQPIPKVDGGSVTPTRNLEELASTASLAEWNRARKA